jgi:hypothetical protein
MTDKTPLHAPQELLAPNTTLQEDLTHAGQRKINLIWEYTQAFIAIVVVVCTMSVGVKIGFGGRPEMTLPTILSTGFGLVVGFYFSRTNHSALLAA